MLSAYNNTLIKPSSLQTLGLTQPFFLFLYPLQPKNKQLRIKTRENMMSVDDLVINLKVIASTQVNEKLCVTPCNKYLVRDERRFQFLLRYFSGDSRLRVITFIEKLLNTLEEKLECLDETNEIWRYDRLIESLNQVLLGLENLKATYRDDRIVLFRFENVIDKLQHLLKLQEENAL